jgi:hypothetical protein
MVLTAATIAAKLAPFINRANSPFPHSCFMIFLNGGFIIITIERQ